MSKPKRKKPIAQKKAEKPIAHSSEERKLESHIIGINGAKVRRCQRWMDRKGQQCPQPAVTGYSVCQSHGAGTRKRVKEGTRKPPGRNAISGLYGTKQYEVILASLEDNQQLEQEQAGLRREATISRMALRNALTLETPILEIQKAIRKVLEGDLDDPEQIQQLARYLQHFKRFNEHIQTMTESVAKLEVAIANIDNKSAQTKMLKEAGVVFGVIKSKVTEYLNADQYEALVLELGKALAEKGWALGDG